MILNGINSALSGLRAFSKKINNSAHNIANINTAGFKKKVLPLQDRKTGGVQAASLHSVPTQGPIISTNGPLNIAIDGTGFLRVGLPNGNTAFTRDGNLKTDSNGRIVTSDGNPIVPEVFVPGNATGLSISASGEISGLINGQTQVLGQIELSSFQSADGLVSQGKNLLSSSSASGSEIRGIPGTSGFGTILQGNIESSNVDIVDESVNLITSSIGFKAAIKTIQAQDEILGTMIDIKE